MSDPRVQGSVAPGFEPVAEEFERNFTERAEVGAAFAVARRGELLVDLWGGSAQPDRGQAWQRDTLQLIFSGTKGLVAACALHLLDRDRLRLDAPVCSYWPEFAAAGKAEVTVAELLSHRARLPGLAQPIAEADLPHARELADLLAAQAPDPDPRSAAIYHPLTFGWLGGELIRRVDGRTVGTYFREELAEPLGLELWIGLPRELEDRVSRISYGPGWTENPLREDGLSASDPLSAKVWGNPPIFPSERVSWNDPRLHRAEVPGINAIGTARSVASLFAALCSPASGPFSAGLSPAAIELASRPLSRFREPFTGEPMAYSVGFQLRTELDVLGPCADAFGHAGAGGSVHAAWPSHQVGVSYAMNQLRYSPAGDRRASALLTATSAALSASR